MIDAGRGVDGQNELERTADGFGARRPIAGGGQHGNQKANPRQAVSCPLETPHPNPPSQPLFQRRQMLTAENGREYRRHWSGRNDMTLRR